MSLADGAHSDSGHSDRAHSDRAHADLYPTAYSTKLNSCLILAKDYYNFITDDPLELIEDDASPRASAICRTT